MINQKDEALKMAINVLELYEEKLNSSIAIEVIQACKEALEQPTNMVTIPLDKLEDMQRRLKEQPISHSCRSDGVCKCEQPTKEEILGKVFDAVYAQYQPKAETQEPVLYIDEGGLDGHATWAQATRCQATDIALYTHPKEWISLSDDEIWDIANFLGKNKEWDYPVMVAKTIEKALKEKNT